ncbi:MAG TPA: glycoside hydrolase family 3 N-terminal domain-containing protein [Kineosporiaceae bacterium]|nr:glycoside hydrolase family 3 N-terminal domain-containing protein [Kineosporiaceae bacterium]
MTATVRRLRTRLRPVLLAPLLALLATTACSAGVTDGASSTDGSGGAALGTSGTPDPAATTTPGAATMTSSATCARRVLATLSDQQRAGQLFIVGVPTTSEAASQAGIAAATRVSAGGYLLLGGSTAPLNQLRELTDRVSRQLAGQSAGIRPFVAADQEGGQIQPLRGPGFSPIPSALVQGGWSPAKLQEAAADWAAQLHAAGVNLAFAPVADVVATSLGTGNQPIGRYQRQFGSDPQPAGRHVAAVVAGYQSAGVSATAKHFPGLGRVIGNPDTSAGVVDSTTTADDPWLSPFEDATSAGTRFVMVSSAMYPRIDAEHLAVFSPAVMGLLRNRFHFQGLIVSDDLGNAAQVADVPPAQRGVGFLAAGGQVVVVAKPPAVTETIVGGVLEAMRSDPQFRAAVDAAALAVLQVKEGTGLLTC